MRVGVLLLMVAVAESASRRWRSRALEDLGRHSLFVYWIHVELVYGVPSLALHGQLPFPVTIGAFILFTAAMLGLVRLKTKIKSRQSTKLTADGRPEKFPARVRAWRNSV